MSRRRRGEDAGFDVHARGSRIDQYVGARIRQRRQQRRLTQVELAAALGVTFQQVQKYERGVNRVSASRLWEIARALGVAVTDFFVGVDEAEGEGVRSQVEAADQAAHFLQDADNRAVATALAAIPSRALRHALIAAIVMIARPPSPRRRARAARTGEPSD